MKGLWASKTLWMNILTIVVQYAGYIPLPAETTTMILGIANILLRWFGTTGPVTVMPSKVG